MNPLNNMTIVKKLLLLLALPFAGLIFFIFTGISERIQVLNQMDALNKLSSLSVKSNLLIHELQRERPVNRLFKKPGEPI